MKIRVPDYYKDFECVASECPDTCCAGWEVDLDDAAWDYYKSVGGAFGERLKSVMVDDSEGKRFRLRPNGRCPFLNDSNLCDLYTELGEEKLCGTCANYPRFIEEYGNLREIGIALSCKEAAKLILKDDKKAEFVTEENDEKITFYNNIDAETYMQLVLSRKTAAEIAQSRGFSISQRQALLIRFADKVQKKIKKGRLSKIAQVCEKFTGTDNLEKQVSKLDKYTSRQEEKYVNMSKYLNTFLNVEIINEDWPKVVNQALEQLHKKDSNYFIQKYEEFEHCYKDNDYEYEHLMVYFIFRYWLKAVNDNDVLTKAKMAAVSYLVIKELDVSYWLERGGVLTKEDQVDIMHLYSREVEHSYENFEELAKLFRTEAMFDVKNLLSMIMN